MNRSTRIAGLLLICFSLFFLWLRVDGIAQSPLPNLDGIAAGESPEIVGVDGNVQGVDGDAAGVDGIAQSPLPNLDNNAVAGTGDVAGVGGNVAGVDGMAVGVDENVAGMDRKVVGVASDVAGMSEVQNVSPGFDTVFDSLGQGLTIGFYVERGLDLSEADMELLDGLGPRVLEWSDSHIASGSAFAYWERISERLRGGRPLWMVRMDRVGFMTPIWMERDFEADLWPQFGGLKSVVSAVSVLDYPDLGVPGSAAAAASRARRLGGEELASPPGKALYMRVLGEGKNTSAREAAPPPFRFHSTSLSTPPEPFTTSGTGFFHFTPNPDTNLHQTLRDLESILEYLQSTRQIVPFPPSTTLEASTATTDSDATRYTANTATTDSDATRLTTSTATIYHSEGKIVFLIPFGWFKDASSRLPALIPYFSSELYRTDLSIPLVPPDHQTKQNNWQLLFLLLLAASFAAHYRLIPSYGLSFLRYFQNHSFFVVDVSEQHIRNQLPGIILIGQWLASQLIVLFTFVTVLMKPAQLGLIHSLLQSDTFLAGLFPASDTTVVSLTQTTWQVSFVGALMWIAALFGTLLLLFQLLWLYLPYRSQRYFHQTLTLLSWPLQIPIAGGFLLVLLMTLAPESISPVLVAVFALVVNLIPFLIASADLSHILPGSKWPYRLATSGLWLFVWILLWIFLATQPDAYEVIGYFFRLG